jgi:hypothetical protein
MGIGSHVNLKFEKLQKKRRNRKKQLFVGKSICKVTEDKTSIWRA